MNQVLGQLVLAVHLVVIAFNVAGLVAIPLGAWRGWTFVRLRWLRFLHLGSICVVALQAAFGRACFLTDWQAALTGEGARDPLIMRWINSLVFYDIPMWVFTAAYGAVLAYALALWWIVPPTRGIVAER